MHWFQFLSACLSNERIERICKSDCFRQWSFMAERQLPVLFFGEPPATTTKINESETAC